MMHAPNTYTLYVRWLCDEKHMLSHAWVAGPVYIYIYLYIFIYIYIMVVGTDAFRLKGGG